MGLIKAVRDSAGGVFADQWKEYFYCESMNMDTLVTKGEKRGGRRSSNRRGSDNIISDGSVIAVADGQCMIIVDQGKVAEICAEPGEFTYDNSTEPSLFTGNLGKSILGTFANIGKRFTFGGEPPKDQRVYYINTKEIMGNKYGTPSPVPFRVVDKNISLDIDINLRCFGEYSFKISDPILFYTNVCGNIEGTYEKNSIEGQMKSDLLTALQPCFGRISEMGIRYSAIPSHTKEIAEILNDELSDKWRNLRGLEIVSFGVSSVKASEEDEDMIKELQRNAAFRDPRMAAAHLVGAQASAMQAAASNESTGPMMAFAGMNMANNVGGMNAQSLFGMGQQMNQPMGQPMQQMGQPMGQQMGQPMQQQVQQPKMQPADTWTCPGCGATVSGKFCPECGTKKPAPATTPDGWVCASCGTVNKGKFCMECGAKKPAGVPQYKCDKCGWEPEDPTHPPKFCPNCGDPFDDGDIQ